MADPFPFILRFGGWWWRFALLLLAGPVLYGGQTGEASPEGIAATPSWRILPLPIQYAPLPASSPSYRLEEFPAASSPQVDYVQYSRPRSLSFAGTQSGHSLGSAVQYLENSHGGGDSLAIGVKGFSLQVPAPTSAQAGRIMIFRGGSNGIAPGRPFTIDGPIRRSFFGGVLASAGDINQDGHAELLIGAPFTRTPLPQGGHAFLYQTVVEPSSRIQYELGWDGRGKKGLAQFGWSGAALGDVNGDGFPDLLIGAPGYRANHLNEGCAVLFRGLPGGPERSGHWTYKGNSLEARFGAAILPTGDLTGDGLADVLIAAPSHSGVKYQGGRVHLFSGHNDGLSAEPLWILEGGETYGSFGSAMTLLTNRQGAIQVALAAPGRADKSADGAVFIFKFSPDGMPLGPAQVFRAEQEGSLFGTALASGDLNGDGWADLVVSAPAFSGGAARLGRVYVLHGGPGGFPDRADWVLEGSDFDDQSGITLAANGDLNGDGCDDLVVGSPLCQIGESKTGRVDIFYGSRQGLPLQSEQPIPPPLELATATPPAPNILLGPWIIAASVSVGSVLLVLRQRRESRRLKAAAVALIEAEREKIARNLHDDLGGELARVLALSRTVAGPNPEPDRVSPAEVAQAAEDLNDTVGRIIWALHPENDRLEKFIEYLGSDIERLCRKRGLRMRKEIPLELPEIRLPRNVREELHLAVKEIATNSIRHSGGDEFRFSAAVCEGLLELHLCDNGSGLPKFSPATPGRGLSNLETRIAQLGGTVRVRSSRETGTEIKLTIPLISRNRNHSGSPAESI